MSTFRRSIDLRHQYGIFGGESQTSLFPFRSSLRDVNERRLYSQASEDKKPKIFIDTADVHSSSRAAYLSGDTIKINQWEIKALFSILVPRYSYHSEKIYTERLILTAVKETKTQKTKYVKQKNV